MQYQGELGGGSHPFLQEISKLLISKTLVKFVQLFISVTIQNG